ncbi:hypothetical protein Tco_1438035 [Tanacetum coccineum]
METASRLLSVRHQDFQSDGVMDLVTASGVATKRIKKARAEYWSDWEAGIHERSSWQVKRLLQKEIKQSGKGILINQENYVKDLLKKYDINGSLVKTPMVPPNNLGPDLNGKAINETQYRGMIGSLMYLTASRPRIQFSTCLCVRQQANLKESHHIAVKRNFRYLKAMSSSEAKYVAAGGCCANILWMKSQLSDYDIVYEKVPIFCDNTSAITFSNNLVLHSRTKHIDIRYHFIRYHIMKGDIELHFIPTQYQLSDIFNKPLEEPTFKRLIVELGMLNIDDLKPESSKNFENES